MATSYDLTPNAATVNENAGSFTFTLTRSSPIGQETAYLSTVQNQGGNGDYNQGDYADKSGQNITFADGETQKSVTVSISNDQTVESSETFGLIVQSDPNAPSSTLASATFTITDDDSTPPPNTLSAATLFAGEGGQFAALSAFSRAAYDDATAADERDSLAAGGWQLLDGSDLGGLPNLTDGMYVNGGAAALIARSPDGKSIVLAFSGTDDGVFANHWPNPSIHYAKFAALIQALDQFTPAVSDVYVTGHTVGAAMAQAFMAQHADGNGKHYQAVTLATPGAIDAAYRSDNRTSNFHLQYDPVQAAANFPPYHTVGDNKKFLFDVGFDLPFDINDTVILQQSPDLYESIIRYATSPGLGGASDQLLAAAHRIVVPSQYSPTLFPVGGGRFFGDGADDDTLIGFTYDELLIGGAGNDHYQFSRENGVFPLLVHGSNDTIADSSGSDKIILNAGATLTTIALEDQDVKIYYASGALLPATITIFNYKSHLAHGGDFELTLGDGTSHTIAEWLALKDHHVDLNATTAIAQSPGSTLNASAVDGLSIVANLATETLQFFNGSSALLSGAAASLIADGTTQTIDGFAHLIGTDLGDRLTGDSQDNIISGNGGDDRIEGGGGNDILAGGGGNDALIGGGGSDTASYLSSASRVFVELWSGAAAIDGLGGHDTLSGIANLIGSRFSDILAGDAGDNLIDGGDGDDTVWGLGGNDTLISGGGKGTVSYSSSAAGVVAELWRGTAANDGLGGHDTVFGFANLTGSGFNDILAGDFGDNIINGGAGNDVVEGLDGNDTLIGGGGIDTASYAGAETAEVVELWNGTASNDGLGGRDTLIGFTNLIGGFFGDILAGDAANNTIEGRGGDDRIWGLGGNDTLIGGEGSDTVNYTSSTGGVFVELWNGTAANDGLGGHDALSEIENIAGSGFADILAGDAGNNTINGGAGNDMLWGLGGNDTLIGGGGSDTVNYTSSTAGVFVELWNGTAANDGLGGHDTLSGIANITGSASADILAGDAGNNTINGGAGNDMLWGQGGNDTLIGGGGTDTASYSSAAAGVFVELWNGTAAADGLGGHDTLSGIANIIGSGFNDILAGDAGDNSINGGAGNDALWGRGGNDTLTGGGGNDTASYSSAAAGVFVELWNGTAANDGLGGHDTLSGIANITGSGFNDILAGDAGDNSINGGAGNDRIWGQAGNDILTGGTGADTFLFNQVSNGSDRIADFNASQDFVSFLSSTYGSVQDVLNHAAQSGNDVVITREAGNVLTLANTLLTDLQQHSDHVLIV